MYVGAVDRVAAETGKELFEVPTGWKYFGTVYFIHKVCQKVTPLQALFDVR